MSRVFPELAATVSDFQSDWVLSLLAKFPTPADIRRAGKSKLGKISHLTVGKAEAILAAAEASIASVHGDLARELVREAVSQVKSAIKAESKFKSLTEQAFKAVSGENHLQSIPGFGAMTSAVLTAKIIDIGRFDSPQKLVGYFGVFPEEYSSGVDPDGTIRSRKLHHMSKKGNDLVRKYLWLASWSASRFNPAAKALYSRKLSEGKPESVALGHVMRKLLHLTFAILKSGKEFDPNYFDWEGMKPRSHKD
jgi:transposase